MTEPKPTFTRQQIQDMPLDDVARRIDEINEALADGRVTDEEKP